VPPLLHGPTQRFLRQVEYLGSLPLAHRHDVAVAVYASIQPYLGDAGFSALEALRRSAQDQRAELIYAGARDYDDVQFAAASIVEQWARARSALCAARPLEMRILAERCCETIERFVRDNLPEEEVES
jgi:hypothetical protein